MAAYAHPEVIVDTEWLASHLSDPSVRIAEVDVDTSAYQLGHIPGAIGWNWNTQLSIRFAATSFKGEASKNCWQPRGLPTKQP